MAFEFTLAPPANILLQGFKHLPMVGATKPIMVRGLPSTAYQTEIDLSDKKIDPDHQGCYFASLPKAMDCILNVMVLGLAFRRRESLSQRRIKPVLRLSATS